jgi:hypothetical protein
LRLGTIQLDGTAQAVALRADGAVAIDGYADIGAVLLRKSAS